MFAGRESNSAFCNCPGHRHIDCKKVTDINERKELLGKYGRCYNCLRKGHLARECKITIKCHACKGTHHKALCGAEINGNSPVDGENEVNVVNNHVATSTRVVLQTAQAGVATSLGLRPLRKEWVGLNTFGQKAVGSISSAC
jgi:hypothetical protein